VVLQIPLRHPWEQQEQQRFQDYLGRLKLPGLAQGIWICQ
jgi:hypothetical protein